MTDQPSETLPDEVMLALAHTTGAHRDALRMFFELDLRLGRIVSATTEPMLGQMRLAWWREVLGKPLQEWPSGDQVLDGIKQHWADKADRLLPLVDAWEHLLAEPPLAEDHARSFAGGRRDAILAALAIEVDHPQIDSLSASALHWALADLASKVSLDDERSLLVEMASKLAKPAQRLPRVARGLAVLAALGRRSLRRGGLPLMDGRGAALVALRAAITGK